MNISRLPPAHHARTRRLVPLLALLACSVVTAQATRPAAPRARGQPTSRPAATQPATAPGAKALSADEVLSNMLKPPPQAAGGARALTPPNTPPALDKTSGVGAVQPAAPPLSVVREGTYIVDRVGRLTRSADGSQAEFTFDSDGKALRDPPLIILPSLKLMAMENAVTGATRDLRFRITGMITEYKGRNYVLLEKVVVLTDTAQQF